MDFTFSTSLAPALLKGVMLLYLLVQREKEYCKLLIKWSLDITFSKRRSMIH